MKRKKTEIKKAVLKNLAIFTGKHLVFPCEFCETFLFLGTSVNGLLLEKQVHSIFPRVL